MINPPQTLEEARTYRYEISKNNPQGYSYVEDHCAFERPYMFFEGDYQCSCKNGHGLAGLYCKQHSKKVKE